MKTLFLKSGIAYGWNTCFDACNYSINTDFTAYVTKGSGNTGAYVEVGDYLYSDFEKSNALTDSDFYFYIRNISGVLTDMCVGIGSAGVVTQMTDCSTISPTPTRSASGGFPSPTRTRTISTSAVSCTIKFLRYNASSSDSACDASPAVYYMTAAFGAGQYVYTNSTCTTHASAGWYSDGLTVFYKTSTGTLGSGAICAGGGKSDRRLKTNIELIGTSPSGLNIYSFEYIDKEKYGEGVYQGVMSDEVPKDAVIRESDGYDYVLYGLLDVEFKRIK